MGEPVYADSYPCEVLTLTTPIDGDGGAFGTRRLTTFEPFDWPVTTVRTEPLHEPAFVVRKLSVTRTEDAAADDSPAALIARLTSGDSGDEMCGDDACDNCGAAGCDTWQGNYTRARYDGACMCAECHTQARMEE